MGKKWGGEKVGALGNVCQNTCPWVYPSYKIVIIDIHSMRGYIDKKVFVNLDCYLIGQFVHPWEGRGWGKKSGFREGIVILASCEYR